MTVQMSCNTFSGSNDCYEEFILWLAEQAGIPVIYSDMMGTYCPSEKYILDPIYFLVDNMWGGCKIPKESLPFLKKRLIEIRDDYIENDNVETLEDVLKRTSGLWNVTKLDTLDRFIAGVKTAISKKRNITYR